MDEPIESAMIQPAPSRPTFPEVCYCWQCGYDLRGLEHGACPECRFRFEVDAVRELNATWGAERELECRLAQLVALVACGVALLLLLTGTARGQVWTGGHAGVIGVIGAVLIVYGLVLSEMLRATEYVRSIGQSSPYTSKAGLSRVAT